MATLATKLSVGRRGWRECFELPVKFTQDRRGVPMVHGARTVSGSHGIREDPNAVGRGGRVAEVRGFPGTLDCFGRHRNLERIDAGMIIGSPLTRIRDIYIVRINLKLASPTCLIKLVWTFPDWFIT